MKTATACLLSTLLLTFWAGLPARAGADSNEEILKEFSTLDQETQRALVKDMVGHLNESGNGQVPMPAEADGTGTSAQNNKRSAANPHAAGKETATELGKFLAPQTLEGHAVEISCQRDNHLLMTTGDVVFLPPTTVKALQPNDRYAIYKRTRDYAAQNAESPRPAWYQQIGKLKILETTTSQTVARIVAAADVISAGDLVYLQE